MYEAANSEKRTLTMKIFTLTLLVCAACVSVGATEDEKSKCMNALKRIETDTIFSTSERDNKVVRGLRGNIMMMGGKNENYDPKVPLWNATSDLFYCYPYSRSIDLNQLKNLMMLERKNAEDSYYQASAGITLISKLLKDLYGDKEGQVGRQLAEYYEMKGGMLQAALGFTYPGIKLDEARVSEVYLKTLGAYKKAKDANDGVEIEKVLRNCAQSTNIFAIDIEPATTLLLHKLKG
jgi:hypothetical protein